MQQQALVQGKIDWDLAEAEQMGMHGLWAAVSTLPKLVQTDPWCTFLLQHILCSSSTSCLSFMCPNYTHSAGHSDRQAIVVPPSCPD